MNFSILTGDVASVLPTLEPNSFDAALCDPPYGLPGGFMGAEWDRLIDKRNSRSDRGFRNETSGGRTTDPYLASRINYAGGATAQRWHEAWSRELLRVLKPGAMLLAFGGTRTHHRLMCALEDAGFEIRDCIMWIFGSGFPKSHSVSAAIDKQAGAVRERIRAVRSGVVGPTYAQDKWSLENKDSVLSPEPMTDAARTWRGYGSALKPAYEPCIVAMKPLDGTFAHNAQKWGVAGINVDGSRIEAKAGDYDHPGNDIPHTSRGRADWRMPDQQAPPNPSGRWPSNVLLDEVAARQLDEMSGERPSGSGDKHGRQASTFCASTDWEAFRGTSVGGDRGGASRFFFTSKVSTREREGSDHPTMKPIDLTRYLAKLILPPQRETPRRIIVPFAGVGSEMIGAILAGWDEVVGIEKDEAYAAKARERIVGTAPLFLTPDDETEDAAWKQPFAR